MTWWKVPDMQCLYINTQNVVLGGLHLASCDPPLNSGRWFIIISLSYRCRTGCSESYITCLRFPSWWGCRSPEWVCWLQSLGPFLSSLTAGSCGSLDILLIEALLSSKEDLKFTVSPSWSRIEAATGFDPRRAGFGLSLCCGTSADKYHHQKVEAITFYCGFDSHPYEN